MTVGVGLSALLLGCILVGGACSARPSAEAPWSTGAKAPARFVARLGDRVSVDLPATRDAFVSYVEARGANYYVTGEGDARPLSAPAPRDGSSCVQTPKAVIFSFAIEKDFMPGYVAYLGGDGMVQCVDKQFSYTGL